MFTISDSTVAVNFISLTKKEQDDLVLLVSGKNPKAAESAKEILISRFEPLIKSVASSYISPKYSEQALIMTGKKGLMKAVNKYHVSKNYRFAAYAAWFIRAEIHKLIGLPVDPENI